MPNTNSLLQPVAGIVFLLWLLVPASGRAAANSPLLLATTTSTDNTGLLDYLVPKFTAATGIPLRWVATGTGKALRLGANCDADVLLVHAPAAEKKYVAAGYAIHRRQVMYNDFVLIGPPADRAGVRGSSAVAALERIRDHQAPFISRGDDSGTNKKELALWRAMGLHPDREPWYIQTGQGMLATIGMAAQRGGYTLTDRGTYSKYAADQKTKPPLVVLVEGDPLLVNQYSVLEVNPERCPNSNNKAAQQWSAWLTGPAGQQAIGAFRVRNKQLFIANAQQ